MMHTLRVNLSLLAFAVSFPVFAAAAHAAASAVPTTVWDYQHAVNPATNVATTGPYDLEDLYRGQNGFALPGDAQIR
jgi:hypothetical protein